jgi:5-bromo-4-chloroindolyl phosphate hydrolysis protein
MAKRPQPTLLQMLDSMLKVGSKLAARWLPIGAKKLEQQIQQTSKEVQNYRQRRKQEAARKPRKARLLWLLPLPLIPAIVIALVSGQLVALTANAIAYALFLAAAILTHRGFEQDVKQQQTQFQISRLWPFKTLGGLTIAIATTFTAWAGAGHSLPVALAFGAGAFTAFILLYGLDARHQPVAITSHKGNNQRVSEALQLAEQKILSIEQASHQITESEMNQRLTRIIIVARQILAEIARDQRDLRRARKFLNTYLDGAQRVVSGYAETHSKNRSRPLEANFRRVLVSIEDVFEQQYQRLLENDLNELDVQMEVLETQLKHEGLN